MTYVTVFDVATAGYQEWPSVMIGVGLTALSGVALLRFQGEGHIFEGDPQVAARGCFAVLVFLAALTWTTVVLANGIPRYLELKNASLNNDCASIAGVVTNFAPMGPGGDEPYESFTVNGVHFRYLRFEITGGYNRYRGPLREGVPVRICYVQGVTRGRNVIIRLEVPVSS